MKRILGLTHRCGLARRKLSSTAGDEDIVIPHRIPRGPTDILRALATTIHRDPTAADYKFIDDPFLIPASNMDKRMYALSKESGRNAAKYMLREFPECFKNNPAEPDVKLFNPPRQEFKPEQGNTVEDLLLCIEEVSVAEALIVYDSLKTHGVEISQGALLKLLQMISFFNATQPPDSSLIEERHFHRSTRSSRSTWKAGGAAEEIFERIEDKNAEAYSALIAGMLKHNDTGRGYKLYEEMRSKGLVPALNVYNILIGCAPSLKEGSEACAELVLEILQNMSDAGVQPNLQTFNSALLACQRMSFLKCSQMCPKILAEMNHMKIEPSLASYHYILAGLYRPRASATGVIREIVDKVAGEKWEMRDSRDHAFLGTAMGILMEYEPDKDLAYKLVDMAEANPHMLINALSHSAFYERFFKVLCLTEDFDKLMLVYHRFVPNTYSPETSVLSEILDSLDFNQAHEYLPQIWSDIICMRHVEREDILSKVLALTAAVKPGETDESKKLQQQCIVIARDIQNRVKEINEERLRLFRMPILLDAEMISNMLQTYLNGNHMEFASETFQYLVKNQQSIPKAPSAEVLMELAKKACDSRDEPMARACATYCSEIGHDEIKQYIKERAVENGFSGEFLERLENNREQSSKEEEG